MIIAAIIIGIILLFLVCVTFYISNRKYGKFEEGVILGIIITSLIFIEIFLICDINDDLQPTAIDVYVYQGKTTHEIIYRDSIPVDSVVVFKK